MELFRALGALSEPIGATHSRLAALLELPEVPGPEAYTDLLSFQMYPYASVYLGPEGMLGGEARDRIAGFWRALKLSPPAEPDHLASLLGFYASLCERPQLAAARKVFFWEHLMSWLPGWLGRVEEIAAEPFYASWARLLRTTLFEEAQALGEEPALSAHLRDAPFWSPDEHSGAELLPKLLSPVRTGVIIAREDLRRIGRQHRLAIRAGERRYVLENLLAQDAGETLRALAAEARRQAERQRRWFAGSVARFWSARAMRTAEALESLSLVADSVR